jgi:hypothetical protein|tara:strand:+ start:171 stop:443 length:273 start_codon:yes stop_codon:yes gene_type:complete
MKKSRKTFSEPKTEEERVKRGNAAESVISSPVFQEAFELLEDKYITSWITSGIDDKDMREQNFLSLRALSDVRLELESMISSGKFAAQKL